MESHNLIIILIITVMGLIIISPLFIHEAGINKNSSVPEKEIGSVEELKYVSGNFWESSKTVIILESGKRFVFAGTISVSEGSPVYRGRDHFGTYYSVSGEKKYRID